MKNKEELRDELKNISPFLFEQKGKPEGFDVPKDYFKSLQVEVFEKLMERPQLVVEEKESWFDQLIKSLLYYFQPRYVMAYATVALLLFAGFYLLNTTTQPQLAETILDEVPDDILQAYISENIDEFEESILTAELADYSNDPLPELNLDTPDDLLFDDLIDDMDIDDLEDLL